MTTSFVGFDRSAASGQTFFASDRISGETLPDRYCAASRADVDRAVELATKAFRAYRDLGGARRAEFLRAVATQLEARREAIVPRAMAE
ncbi:MAG TPA: aldehyde dehydrogenase family protein, partial [Fimbriimonadaceae bacterium]|nr:aldehyde dehydrogenase family protein [Fimbriimonadaceae bacterium]